MTAMKKTTFRTKAEISTKWMSLDASGQIVGRLASKVAMLLMGKTLPDYTPSVDMGCGVIVFNCEKVVFSGAKWNNKLYYHHSGYIGGLKSLVARRVFNQHPDRILFLAVKRMLPKGKLGERMIKKLKIYPGAGHPHAAQKPESLPSGA